jgi:hypothetical protein
MIVEKIINRFGREARVWWRWACGFEGVKSVCVKKCQNWASQQGTSAIQTLSRHALFGQPGAVCGRKNYHSDCMISA